jgi:hypothetical protein
MNNQATFILQGRQRHTTKYTFESIIKTQKSGIRKSLFRTQIQLGSERERSDVKLITPYFLTLPNSAEEDL